MKQVLRVLVGSKAHGLSTIASDYDYRGVFIEPTINLLKLYEKPVSTRWAEGEEDNISYEIGHVLKLAVRSNPSILEVFCAPIIESTSEGLLLRDLFPYVWSSKGVLDAFVGYSHNQQKKMMDDKYESRERKWKYAVAYARVLIQAQHLLRDGILPVEMPIEWINPLRNIKEGAWSTGKVIDFCNSLKTVVYQEYERNPNKQSDIECINAFLLDIRQKFWNI